MLGSVFQAFLDRLAPSELPGRGKRRQFADPCGHGSIWSETMKLSILERLTRKPKGKPQDRLDLAGVERASLDVKAGNRVLFAK